MARRSRPPTIIVARHVVGHGGNREFHRQHPHLFATEMNTVPGLGQGPCHATGAWTALGFPDKLGLVRGDRREWIGHVVSPPSDATGCSDCKIARAKDLRKAL
jgi:hypothetical protein